MSIRRVTQLELENFAQGIQQAEDAAGKIEDKEEIPSWADVYQQLLNANVRPRIAAYIAWATMPKKYRYPETQDKLAVEVLGLTSDRAIATWRKRFPEIDMMISQLQAEAMLDYRSGALHAFGTVASDPSYP